MSAEVVRLSPPGGASGKGAEDFLERNMTDVLVEAGLVASKNIARQKIREGAVSTSAGRAGVDESRIAHSDAARRLG